ncbi:lac repressor [Amycolatopsis sp. M39]|nr:lac repressor [Amycolatopsis sp. M39]
MLHPSTRAASISSYGKASTVYCRIQNTPNAVTGFGTITDCSPPAQPSFDTASVTTMNTNKPLRPRKRSLAKANPASDENSTVVSVTVPLSDAGREVPGDVAVVSFDDNAALAPAMTPPLTSVHQDPREQVHAMVSTLMRLLDGEDVTPGAQVLPVSLVVRESS